MNAFYARRVVLATGRGGAGGDKIPDFIDVGSVAGSRSPYQRGYRLRAAGAGRSIGIVGGGASAWDNAATALEHGAARVDMYVRRHSLAADQQGPRLRARRVISTAGQALDDAERWALFVYLNDAQAPPPHETVRRRAAATGVSHPFRQAGRACRRGSTAGSLVSIRGEDVPRLHDFLIVGTGFHVGCRTNPGTRPLFAAWLRAGAIATSRRKSCGDRSSATFLIWVTASNCWSGSPGSCTGLSRIHLVNHGAALEPGCDRERHPRRQRRGRAGLDRYRRRACFAEDIGEDSSRRSRRSTSRSFRTRRSSFRARAFSSEVARGQREAVISRARAPE